jgi:hypothetical protein
MAIKSSDQTGACLFMHECKTTDYKKNIWVDEEEEGEGEGEDTGG